ncbi:hypothetical protein QBE52_04575 [Clostridiaceae bacterium 35-E11]
MLFNIIFGYILAWIFLLLIYKKDKRIVFFITPFASVVAYTVNAFGLHLNLWGLTPIEYGHFSALPFDLGYFAFSGVFLVFLTKRLSANPYMIVLVTSIIITLMEYTALLLGKVVYYNNWNIFGTFISYLVSHTIVYWYYLWTRRYFEFK